MENDKAAGIQKLALAEAIIKALKPLTDTRGGKGGVDNLRTRADDELRRIYAESGADRRQIDINGVKVGTLSLAFTKPVDRTEIGVLDMDELIGWLRDTDEGRDTLAEVLTGYKTLRAVLDTAQAFGFMPDGCSAVEVHDPAHIKGTTLRVDTQKVAEALAGQLPVAVAGLISGEVE
ncbi:MAG TPA: hypothetical protein IAC01_02615 [Candidatus Limicola stercorigallinarum]|nr:hypothetical protein [Candidatus Limicola stercorigallinarum]